ncbi:MAG: 50S ribosomal protein L18 [Candidatus Micrarchaeales archaeon]
MKYRMIKKRRRTALTDYSKRVALLMGNMPRVVIRKSNRSITLQIVNFEPAGDKVVATANSKELMKFNWAPRSNIPTAYLTGLLLASKAKKLNLNEIVVDIGLSKPQKSSVMFAAAKGVADGGLKVLNSIEFDEKRLKGSHISEYAKLIKSDAETYKRQFSGYTEQKFEVEKLSENFESAKKKIMSE